MSSESSPWAEALGGEGPVAPSPLTLPATFIVVVGTASTVSLSEALGDGTVKTTAQLTVRTRSQNHPLELGCIFWISAQRQLTLGTRFNLYWAVTRI